MRFDAVVFVPSAPLLLLGGVPADLEATITEALEVLVGDVVVLGDAPRSGWWEGSVDITPYGCPGEPADDALPLALAVGRTLLGDRPHRLWGTPGLPPEGDSLVVVGDGSAKRTEKAPGYIDPRAAGYDAQVAAALRAGDPRMLAEVDFGLGAELMVSGVPAWTAVAELKRKRNGRVLYDDAPYGVGYFVATWVT
jgi:hypothetical protein